jgi:LuxR family maltose regulon positive regulatory protein
MEKENLRAAWFSLDEEDNEPDLFFRYLLTAFIQTNETLMNSLAPMLTHRGVLGAGNVLPHLIEALSSLPQDILLILDDYHKIANDGIHAGMARLLKYLPAGLRLVVLSRYALPASVDAAVANKDRMALTAEDLKFTEAETVDFLKGIVPNGFSADQMRDLNRQVEGWAAGLQLIGLAIRSKGATPDRWHVLNQAHEQVANYLIHDILKAQPPKVREFVLATALLDRFTAELCAEVTGMPDAAGVLDQLERMNLFLIPLDAGRKWYRYHHMFSEVVRRQRANREPEAICMTLRKAALWLARNNHLEDALRSAFRSKDHEFAADLMEDHIMGYLETFDLASGLRWILKLPESILNQRALLRLQQCAFLFISMEPAEVKEILSAVERDGNPDFSRYSGDKLALCHDYAVYFKCMLSILYVCNTEVLAQYQELQTRLLPRNPILVAAIEMMVVFVLIANGELSTAEDFLDKVSQLPLSNSGQVLRKKIYFAKAHNLIAKHRGRLRQAEAIILQVRQLLDQQGCGDLPMAFLLHRHLGHIFYLQNRLDEARECAAIALKHCKHSGLIDEIMTGNELQLQLHLAAGEKEQALECIRQMQAFSIKIGMPQIAASADACAARFAIDQGNLGGARLWSRRRKLLPDEPFSMLFAMECLTEARLLYAQGRYQRAAHLLEALRQRCLRRNLGDLVLQIDILLAATLHAMQQHEKAASLLKEALAFSENEGYLRPFVNDAGLIAPVLRCIADEQSCALSVNFLEQVLAACHVPRVRSVVPHRYDHHGYEALTQREMEILGWMAQGLQNLEIARKGFVSLNTVKSHVRKILVKLSVKTRTQAILKARKMKIVPME